MEQNENQVANKTQKPVAKKPATKPKKSLTVKANTAPEEAVAASGEVPKTTVVEAIEAGQKSGKAPLKMLVTVVSRGYSSEVVQAAREAGSEGAMILEGRGLGKTEAKFFGLRIEPETELVLIAVPEKLSVKVAKAIYKKFDFTSEARCMVLVLPIANYFI